MMAQRRARRRPLRVVCGCVVLEVGDEVVGEHIACGDLRGRDHLAQHLGLAAVVGGELRGCQASLALQAVGEQFGW